MRFNSKELIQLAQNSAFCDKEGCLWMRHKPEGLFKRKDGAFNQRLIRLKGNLLFYFKNCESKSDVLGVIVLERCAVELETDEVMENTFKLLTGEDEQYCFGCESEFERDRWISALHSASYEFLKMQLQSLREQIQSKSGNDPMTQSLISMVGYEFDSTKQQSETQDPAIEISLACKDLPSDIDDISPSVFVVLETMLPPQISWLQHSHTEVVEDNKNPQFLKTIGFGDSEGVDTDTRIKLTIYHVKERMTCTMIQLGMTIFTLQDILMASELKLSLSLKGQNHSSSGTIMVNAWINESTLSLFENLEGKALSGKDTVSLLKNKRRKSLQNYNLMKLFSGDIITRTFRFETNNSNCQLLVHEYMCESKYSFDIPFQLLEIWVKEERQYLDILEELGELHGDWKTECHEMMDMSFEFISEYNKHADLLKKYKGPGFLPSCDRHDKETEFVPINLHLQRMTVTATDKSTMEQCYDVITVGVFAAHTMKFRGGGLRRHLKNYTQQYSIDKTMSTLSRLDSACMVLNKISQLKADIESACEVLCNYAAQGLGKEMKSTSDHISTKVKDLVEECDSALLHEVAEMYLHVKPDRVTPPDDNLKYLNSRCHVSMPPRSFNELSDEEPRKDSWRWTGTNFVRSTTVEPWDITRLNTEAAAVCLISIIDDLIADKKDPSDASKWLGEISQAVLKLQGFLEIVQKRALVLFSFLSLAENRGRLGTLRHLRKRRDLVFSRAITSLVAGFVTKLSSNLTNKDFLQQVNDAGILACFNGLLTPFTEENGMIEDSYTAINDISHVIFRLEEGDADCHDIHPTLSASGNLQGHPCIDLTRRQIIVSIKLPPISFLELPQVLRNKNIKVTTVQFNVGINEQVTLAEKFGDITLQDRINAENVQKLYDYYQSCNGDLKTGDEDQVVAGSLSDLFQQLHYNILSRKSRNVEIMKITSEICRNLNGILFTSCKSAKDRTGMEVTLDQVYVLQQCHGLASHVFMQALDCFRSEGVRIENTLKNTGIRKFAFNSLQLFHYPKLYRPPKGSFGTNVA